MCGANASGARWRDRPRLIPILAMVIVPCSTGPESHEGPDTTPAACQAQCGATSIYNINVTSASRTSHCDISSCMPATMRFDRAKMVVYCPGPQNGSLFVACSSASSTIEKSGSEGCSSLSDPDSDVGVSGISFADSSAEMIVPLIVSSVDNVCSVLQAGHPLV